MEKKQKEYFKQEPYLYAAAALSKNKPFL